MPIKNQKSLGQHWLKDRAILDQIADLAVVPGVDTCLEIGPGLGTLTSSLLRRFPRVIAVEYDARLAANLPASFPGKNLTVHHQDFLQFDLSSLDRPTSSTPHTSAPSGTSSGTTAPYVVAGNIPYYITTPIIQKLLTAPHPPAKIVLLIQKEVAERLAAVPGHHSQLSLFTQNFATVELGPVVPAREFTPPPKVDSQVVVLTPRSAPQVSSAALALARRGFSNPRKKLATNLATPNCPKPTWQSRLVAQNLNPDARAQDLALADWEHLAAT